VITELLIGCGHSRKKQVTFDAISEHWSELITLDINPEVNPSVVHDLTDLPLPFDDDMFDEIHAYEILEHTGQQGDWRFFFNQFYEFWRILKPGGYLIGSCPMWDSMWAWSDPGHTRVITEGTLTFLSQKEYKVQLDSEGVTAMTDYRAYWDGDFDMIAKHDKDETFGFVIQAVK